MLSTSKFVSVLPCESPPDFEHATATYTEILFPEDSVSYKCNEGFYWLNNIVQVVECDGRRNWKFTEPLAKCVGKLHNML